MVFILKLCKETGSFSYNFHIIFIIFHLIFRMHGLFFFFFSFYWKKYGHTLAQDFSLISNVELSLNKNKERKREKKPQKNELKEKEKEKKRKKKKEKKNSNGRISKSLEKSPSSSVQLKIFLMALYDMVAGGRWAGVSCIYNSKCAGPQCLATRDSTSGQFTTFHHSEM